MPAAGFAMRVAVAPGGRPPAIDLPRARPRPAYGGTPGNPGLWDGYRLPQPPRDEHPTAAVFERSWLRPGGPRSSSRHVRAPQCVTAGTRRATLRCRGDQSARSKRISPPVGAGIGVLMIPDLCRAREPAVSSACPRARRTGRGGNPPWPIVRRDARFPAFDRRSLHHDGQHHDRADGHGPCRRRCHGRRSRERRGRRAHRPPR